MDSMVHEQQSCASWVRHQIRRNKSSVWSGSQLCLPDNSSRRTHGSPVPTRSSIGDDFGLPCWGFSCSDSVSIGLDVKLSCQHVQVEFFPLGFRNSVGTALLR